VRKRIIKENATKALFFGLIVQSPGKIPYFYWFFLHQMPCLAERPAPALRQRRPEALMLKIESTAIVDRRSPFESDPAFQPPHYPLGLYSISERRFFGGILRGRLGD
jgi:hypothetical protein